MRHISRFILIVAGAGLVWWLAGCGTTRVAGGKAYHVTAYRPHNPSAVRVKVSLATQNIYVMEGDRSLMAVACSVGLPNKPTPRGNFTIYSKQEQKRYGEYGFSVIRALFILLRAPTGVSDCMVKPRRSFLRW
ncbi:MAG: hypothetical protein DMF28_00140 [Verrucomicrobia bacterium]|nr:MAG: hypothetical protein DMF28_00140 [Verrucomicrobiota bacterium]